MSALRGSGFCPVQAFCGQGWFFRCGCPHFFAWCKKLRIFRNLWCARRPRTDKKSWANADKGKGVNFCDFVRTSFTDGP